MTIPELTLRWRLKLSLDHAGISPKEMAAELGVTRPTVSGWLIGRRVPGRVYLRVWAEMTGVPLEWLETGAVPDPNSNSRPRLVSNGVLLPAS